MFPLGKYREGAARGGGCGTGAGGSSTHPSGREAFGPRFRAESAGYRAVRAPCPPAAPASTFWAAASHPHRLTPLPPASSTSRATHKPCATPRTVYSTQEGQKAPKTAPVSRRSGSKPTTSSASEDKQHLARQKTSQGQKDRAGAAFGPSYHELLAAECRRILSRSL